MFRSGTIAAENRKRVLELVGDPNIVVVATSIANVVYSGGYRSMGFDTDPGLKMAVVFNERKVVLVGPLADLWAARESCPGPFAYYGYGRFFFDHQNALNEGDVDFASFQDFDAALQAAIAALSNESTRIACDFLPTYSSTGFQADPDWIRRIFVRARSLKSASEIDVLRRATELTENAVSIALENARAGVAETDIAAEISATMVRSGLRPGFIVVTSGPRSAFADAFASSRKLVPGDLVRIDVGGTLNGYWSDTACSAVVGEPTPEVERVNHALMAGQAAALDAVFRRVSTEEVFNATTEAVRQAGLASYRRHHVGHGLGVESHEFPTICRDNSEGLIPGMVINVETPYYRAGWGGLMYEDTLLIGKSAVERLTALPNTLVRLPG